MVKKKKNIFHECIEKIIKKIAEKSISVFECAKNSQKQLARVGSVPHRLSFIDVRREWRPVISSCQKASEDGKPTAMEDLLKMINEQHQSNMQNPGGGGGGGKPSKSPSPLQVDNS